MESLRKILSFTLENLTGKLIFFTFFLPFSRVPEAVGEVFAVYFFHFAVGLGWARRGAKFPAPPSPRVKVWSLDVGEFFDFYLCFSLHFSI